jgi:uncharacterized protein
VSCFQTNLIIGCSDTGTTNTFNLVRRFKKMAKKYFILSCDGGGVKGYLTTRMVADLQSECQIMDSVDMLAGTSTGSIIALGLAEGISPEDLVTFYSDKNIMEMVFSPYTISLKSEDVTIDVKNESTVNQHLQFMKDNKENILKMLLYPKYFSYTRREAIAEYLKDIQITELARKVVVTTFQINKDSGDSSFRWCPVVFHNLPDTSLKNGQNDVSIIDAAMCSSAAPIYFPPYQIGNNQYIDGGVYANNPSALAIAALINSSQLGNSNLVFSDVYMLSLGTGMSIKNFPFVDLNTNEGKIGNVHWGLMDWFIGLKTGKSGSLLDVIMDGSSECVDFQSQMLLNERYRRADIKLDEPIQMDDYNAIDKMKAIADLYLQSPEWQSVKDWVKAVLKG